MSRVIAVLSGWRGAVIAAGMRGIAGVGSDGRGVTGVSIGLDNHLIVAFSDGTTQDAGLLPNSEELVQLQELVTDLLERVTKLESGQPVIPANALTNEDGQVLTDSAGETLTLGD